MPLPLSPPYVVIRHVIDFIISPPGAVALAEYVVESPRLLRLDVRENEVKTGGLMALAHALKVNTSLTRIDLDPKPKKESVRFPVLTDTILERVLSVICRH